MTRPKTATERWSSLPARLRDGLLCDWESDIRQGEIVKAYVPALEAAIAVLREAARKRRG